MMLKVSSLVQNNGQLGWLPKNPRQWTQTDIDRTAASIREDEDFLEDRPLLVVPKDAKTWVVFAGNLRLTAAKKIGLKEVPCIAYARETDEDDTTIKRRAMKDNGSFGAWDYDALANEWDDLPLNDWGVPVWNGDAEDEDNPGAGVSPDKFGEEFSLEDGERSPFRQMSFSLSDEQAAMVKNAVDLAIVSDGFVDAETYGNDNEPGNALAFIAKTFVNITIAGIDNLDARLAEGESIEEELRNYLRDALKRSGRKAVEVDELLGTEGMSGHYFGASQWMFPTREAYEKMKTILPLDRDWSVCKKRETMARFYQTIGKITGRDE